MPAFALAAVTADWIVRILLGPSWAEAVPLVALFSVSATFLPVLTAVGLLYMTQARTGEMLRATLIDAALCVASIVVGLHWGVVGIAASIALVGLVVRTPVAFWLATRRGPVSAAFVWRAVAPPASAAALVALAVGCLRRFEHEPTWMALASTAVVGVSAASLALLVWPEIRRELRQLQSKFQAA